MNLGESFCANRYVERVDRGGGRGGGMEIFGAGVVPKFVVFY